MVEGLVTKLDNHRHQFLVVVVVVVEVVGRETVAAVVVLMGEMLAAAVVVLALGAAFDRLYSICVFFNAGRSSVMSCT